MTAKATRSPNSPSRPLGSCFNDAMRLFDVFPNTSFDQLQIANVLGFSATSGAYKGLLSDLKQYGLIEKGSTGDFIIASALKEYALVDEAEKDAIKYSFATRPKVFSQIIESQGYHLPDVGNLANVLVVRFGFNKAKAAKTAKALRDSLEWANALDDKGNVLMPRGNQKNHPASSSSCEGSAEVADESHHAPLMQTRTDDTLTTDVPIGNGRIVHVQYPKDLTADEASKVGKVLSALSE